MVRCVFPSFTIIFFLDLIAAALSSQCLPTLRTNSQHFNVCTTNECFIFLDERPFVFVEEKMTKSPDFEKPFRCIDYLKHSRNLRGAFFDIIQKMPTLSEAYCVYGGSKCTFNMMTAFINQTTPEMRYKWIAGGILFTVPNRIQLNLIPSASLLEDTLLVIGPPLRDTTLPEAWKTIWKPFSPKAWMFVIFCMFGHMAARVWMAWRFSRQGESTRFNRWKERFIETGAQPLKDNEDWDEHERWERMNAWWGGIAKLYIGITVVLWEVAIAVLVFDQRTTAPLADLRPEQFVMWKDSTQEHFFMQMNGIETPENAQWLRASKQSQVFKALRGNYEQYKNTKYTLMYETMTRWRMETQPEMCDSLRVYDHMSPQLVARRTPPSISGTWLYSGNVNQTRRMEIDREIVDRKIEVVPTSVDSVAGASEISDQCQSKTRQIDWILIALLLGIAPGLLFVVFCTMIGYYSLPRFWEDRPVAENLNGMKLKPSKSIQKNYDSTKMTQVQSCVTVDSTTEDDSCSTSSDESYP